MLPMNGSQGAFVSVFASDGNHLWSTRMDGNSVDVAYSVAFDQSGRLAVTGYYDSTKLSIYHASGQVAAMLPCNGVWGAFVSMFTSEGSHLWSTRMDGDGADQTYSVAFDTSGHLAVSGYYTSPQLLIYHSNGDYAAMLPRNGSQGAFVSVFDVDVGVPNAAFTFGAKGNSATSTNGLPEPFVPSNSVLPAWIVAVIVSCSLVGFTLVLLFLKLLNRRSTTSAENTNHLGSIGSHPTNPQGESQNQLLFPA
jgi:hypothetical protein